MSKVSELLEKTPGQAVRELSKKLDVNRTYLAGYLQSLEDLNRVESRKVGPARLYYNKNGSSKVDP